MVYIWLSVFLKKSFVAQKQRGVKSKPGEFKHEFPPALHHGLWILHPTTMIFPMFFLFLYMFFLKIALI